MPFNKILIAIDDSAVSIKAARSGFELAHRLQSVIAILCVVDKGMETVNADLGITLESSRVRLQEEAERTLEQYIRMFDGIGEVFRFTPEGVPEKVILDIASQWQADLIVMGTHGRGGLSRMVAGSVAEYVVRHASVPVLLTPPNME